MGLTAEASTLTEAGMAKFPEDVHMAMEWARMPQSTHDWEEAERRWSIVHERFPTHAGVQSGHAWALSKKGKSVDAEILIKAAIAQAEAASTVDAPLLRSYAECAAERADWAEAEARWRDVIARFPDQAANWSGLVEMLRSAGRMETADEVVATALQRFPDDMDLQRQRALTATLRRDWPVALALWEDLKRRHPRNPGIQGGITQALWQARQDLGVASSEGSTTAAFVIPPLLLESNKATGERDGLDKLFLRFETIGDTCEFGIVQRRFGAEPISLLRWASTPPRQAGDRVRHQIRRRRRPGIHGDRGDPRRVHLSRHPLSHVQPHLHAGDRRTAGPLPCRAFAPHAVPPPQTPRRSCHLREDLRL